MPNTPALVGAGATAIAGGSHATDADLAWAEAVLGLFGVVVRVSESQLDAVTGLSGSGPAYVPHRRGDDRRGVAAGLPRDLATTLAEQTLVGSARLLAEGSDSAADQRRGHISRRNHGRRRPGAGTSRDPSSGRRRRPRRPRIEQPSWPRDRASLRHGHPDQ